MKLFINTKTKQYPVHNVPGDLVANPTKRVHTKPLPAKAAKSASPRLKVHPKVQPFAEVNLTTKPVVDYNKNVVEGAPVETAGEWHQVWNVVDATAEEIAARVSAESKKYTAPRDAKLAASDWTQVADSPVDKAAWATYRQALRDITAQAGFPWTPVVWPLAPGETTPVPAKAVAKIVRSVQPKNVPMGESTKAPIVRTPKVIKIPTRKQKTA